MNPTANPTANSPQPRLRSSSINRSLSHPLLLDPGADACAVGFVADRVGAQHLGGNFALLHAHDNLVQAPAQQVRESGCALRVDDAHVEQGLEQPGGGDEGRQWLDLARFKDRAVARLLPPESAALNVVSRAVGVGEGTLERWDEWNGRQRVQMMIEAAQ